MSDWQPRVFWKTAEAIETDAGHEVRLDGRPVRTPAKTQLVLPTAALAAAICQEWQAQEEVVDPGKMPLTRTANSVLDKVMPQQAGVAEVIAEYGGADLLCYRASGPSELVARQAEAWDPLLKWAEEHLDAPLRVGEGVVHVAQPAESLAALRARVLKLSPWQLAAFHDLVALSGSLVIGFAATQNKLPVEELWQTSRIDETWQIEQWGEDDEATATAAVKQAAFLDAHRFLELCK